MLVLLKTGSGCDMRCDYCYGDCGEKSATLSVADCALLAARLNEFAIPGRKLEFLWHGGEPSHLGAKKFADMVETLNALTNAGVEIRHSMQSNGLGLSGEWPKTLARHKVSLGVSMDGPADLHDAARKLPNGEGTHAKIRANVYELIEKGVTPALLCAFTPRHAGREEEFVDWALETNLPIRVNPLFAKGRASVGVSLATYYAGLRKIFALALKKRVDFSIQPLEWILKSILYDEPPSECSHSGRCGANIFAFGPGGDVSFCTRHDGVLGNLRKSSLDEILLSPLWQKRRERILNPPRTCVHCSAHKFCNGGCPETMGDAPKADDCAAIRDFFAWFKNDGLALYLNALVTRKREIGESLVYAQKVRDKFGSL